MKLFMFDSTGFKEIDNFIWDKSEGNFLDDEVVISNKGYTRLDTLLPDKEAYWIDIYTSDNNECKFLIAICDVVETWYLVCRSFVDYLEFMRKYLPTIELLNKYSKSSKKDVDDLII